MLRLLITRWCGWDGVRRAMSVHVQLFTLWVLCYELAQTTTNTFRMRPHKLAETTTNMLLMLYYSISF